MSFSSVMPKDRDWPTWQWRDPVLIQMSTASRPLRFSMRPAQAFRQTCSSSSSLNKFAFLSSLPSSLPPPPLSLFFSLSYHFSSEHGIQKCLLLAFSLHANTHFSISDQKSNLRQNRNQLMFSLGLNSHPSRNININVPNISHDPYVWDEFF